MIKIIEKIKQKIRFKQLENRIFKLQGEELQVGIGILRLFWIEEARSGGYTLKQLTNFNDSVEEILEEFGV